MTSYTEKDTVLYNKSDVWHACDVFCYLFSKSILTRENWGWDEKVPVLTARLK